MGRDLEVYHREIEATRTLTREIDTNRRAREQREQRQRAKVVLRAVDQADRRRHGRLVVKPGVAEASLVTVQERIRRAASWPSPTQGAPQLPLAEWATL
ncbi:hypothetical protein ACFVIM_01435 [Streptomyces sp. NPDC057638]|uniref:hypothetical protein n=1 Tax=Streptomyces sp. NPDC057638 TaxID=3346190 RepID=UPI0036C4F9FA